MKSERFWQQYQDYTIEVSTNLRVLGFGAIGISWIFKRADFTFPTNIRWVLLFTILYFLADMTQYFVSAVIYRNWLYKQELTRHEAGEPIDGDMEKPRWLDSFAYFMWFAKFLLLITAYLFLGCHILKIF